MQMLLIVCPLVFLAGFVDSIAGGGGLIALPAFLLAGLPPHTAIATNKLSSTIGTTLSTARLARHLDLPLAAVSVACALAGSAIGSRLSLLVGEQVIEFLLIPVLV
ncbi:MAG: TSUP family transporter, partial [Oscillospiraceae bacterium]|nr:TSUP family transporter [Oscillospiraceae bacterium]